MNLQTQGELARAKALRVVNVCALVASVPDPNIRGVGDATPTALRWASYAAKPDVRLRRVPELPAILLNLEVNVTTNDKAPDNASNPVWVRLTDQYFDQRGHSISLGEWARKRRDPNYCCFGYCHGKGAAWVCTFWLGLDVSFGKGALPSIFDTQVSAFGNQPMSNGPVRQIHTSALVLHQRVVRYVERGITPLSPLRPIPLSPDTGRAPWRFAATESHRGRARTPVVMRTDRW